MRRRKQQQINLLRQAIRYPILMHVTPEMKRQWKEADKLFEPIPVDVSLCRGCYCMTHTINGKCGKCQEPKDVSA